MWGTTMHARWFVTLFIALSILVPSAVPSFAREVQQVLWCVVLDMERNAYRRQQEQAVEDDE